MVDTEIQVHIFAYTVTRMHLLVSIQGQYTVFRLILLSEQTVW